MYTLVSCMDVLWDVFEVSSLLSNAAPFVLWLWPVGRHSGADWMTYWPSSQHISHAFGFPVHPYLLIYLLQVQSRTMRSSHFEWIGVYKTMRQFCFGDLQSLFISEEILIIKPNQSRSYKAKIKPTMGITRRFPEYKWSCKIHCCTKASFIQIHQVFILITFIALLPPFTFKCKSYFVILLKILYRTKENYYTNAIT